MKTNSFEREINEIYDLILNAINDEDLLIIQERSSLIESIERNFEQSFHLKKKFGAFYTNQEISDFILTRTLTIYVKRHIPDLKIQNINEIISFNDDIKGRVCNLLMKVKICDPACGLGVFLLSALEIIFSLVSKLHPEPKLPEIKLSLLKNLFGFEINQSALKICKMKLFYWAMSDMIIDFKKIIKIISSNLTMINSLFDQQNQNFDLIVGNPPYGNIIKTDEKKLLKEQKVYYNDIYCAFLLRSLQWTEGIIGFLVPKSFLLRQSYLQFRQRFLSKANLLEIFDIGPNLFKRATNEVQIIIFETNLGNSPPLLVYNYPDEEIIIYPKQNYDNLRVCLNKKCPLCSVVRKIFVYTFAPICPYCGANTTPLNRIRIKVNKISKDIIEKIEREGDLNFLNIRDFPKMIRGEEDYGLKEIRKLIKSNDEGNCNFLYAKDDLQYYYYKKNKTFDLKDIGSTILKGKDFEYYIQPKLIIKHNNIFPQAVYSEDCLCFTSSIYSLLDENNEILKYLSALINSSVIQFYCLYAINNQRNTTINLNQYMIRHLPLKNIDNNVKLTINNKVEAIMKAFRRSQGKIDKFNAKIWQEIDESVFQIYALPEKFKEYILTSLENKLDFLKQIYSFEKK